MITILGLGPLGIDQMSMGAYRALRSAPIVFVRTSRHPAVDELAAEGITMESFDSIYESADSFEHVYEQIAERVLEEAGRRDVLYAVPGHPLVGEASVSLLMEEARKKGIECRVIGSESFIEASLEALGIGIDEGIKIIDALSLDSVSPDTDIGNLIYQVYDRQVASETKLKLMEHYPDDFEIMVVSGAGGPEQRVETIPLYQLDRCECDHLTTVYVPEMR